MPESKTATHPYEAMFLFGAQAASEPEAAINTVRGIIERHGGQIIVLKKWDERKLAYEMHGQKRGAYILAFYNGPGSSVGAIERDVNLSEEILRVLVLRADHLNKDEMAASEPQPIQPREERAPWDRPDFNKPMHDDRRSREDRPPRDDRPHRGLRREEGAEAAAKE